MIEATSALARQRGHWNKQANDPATNTWSVAGNLAQGRNLVGAGLAGNGKAVLAGGSTSTSIKLSSSELYTE